MSQKEPPRIFGYDWTVQWGHKEGMTLLGEGLILPEMWGGFVCTCDFVRARREVPPYYPVPQWAQEAFEEVIASVDPPNMQGAIDVSGEDGGS